MKKPHGFSSKSLVRPILGIGILIVVVVIYNLFNRPNSSYVEHFSNNNADVKMFYVDWCGHCKTTKPGYRQFMQQYNDTQVNKKNVRVEMINCEENETNAQLASQYNVKGYPTIIATVDGHNYVYANSDKSAEGFGTWLKSLL